MQRTRGTAITPIISGIAFVAAIAGGFVAGRQRPAVARDAVTTHGEWVKFCQREGRQRARLRGLPGTRGQGSTVIVIHEIFGMTDWEPTMADRFAGKGYIGYRARPAVIAGYGMSPPTTDSGRKLVATLTDAGVIADLDASYKYVNALPAAQKDNSGVIGFCWGGGTVWKYASANPKLGRRRSCAMDHSPTLR